MWIASCIREQIHSAWRTCLKMLGGRPQQPGLRTSVFTFKRLLLVFTGILAVSGATNLSTIAPASTARFHIVYLSGQYSEPPPLSQAEKIPLQSGIQGARVGLMDDNVAAHLLGREFQLVAAVDQSDPVTQARSLLSGNTLVVADLETSDLLAVADLPEARNAMILDVRTSDDSLRQEQCRENVFHIAPSWSMRADALAQYLFWKHWRQWVLVRGNSPADVGFANAIKRAASRFRGQIVAERIYEVEAGSRHASAGHQLVQRQLPSITAGLPDHDVVFVVDTGETFGDYLPYNTSNARPVVGTHGLAAVAWHPAFVEYSASNLQNRFGKRVGRDMTERDYTAWLGVRVLGEAAIRTGSADAHVLYPYVLSDQFSIAGYKGIGMSFRHWDLQLRQPILLSGPRALVSISPQDGFMHPRFSTDTLGFDEAETKCHLAL
jgi:ABC transporter substrate binding protein (PQQ-dependent alcohol dehydrogenase system)